jgi:type IV pilus assembly protein PilC
MAQFSYSQMAAGFQRMAVSYSAGIDIRKIVRRETEYGSTAYRKTFSEIAAKVDKGDPLGPSMAAAGDESFPVLATSVIRAGEQSGRLEDSFKRLSEHYKSLADFRQRFLSSIAWPCFQLVAAVGIIGLLILVLDYVYRLGNVEPIDWFGLGSTTANFLAYLFTVLLLAGGGYFLYQGVSKGWFGILPMKIARRIPLIGKTIECLALSRFAWTMSVCENAGMNPMETIRLAIGSTENYFYQQLEPELISDLQKGQPYYEAMEQTDAFPDDLLIYVDNGETAGELAESMDRASRELQDRAEQNLKTISGIGFFLIFSLVAVLIGGTVILLYNNLYLKTINEFL